MASMSPLPLCQAHPPRRDPHTLHTADPHRAPAPGTCGRTCRGSIWWHQDSRRRQHSGSRRCCYGTSCSPRPEGSPPPRCGDNTQALLRDTVTEAKQPYRSRSQTSPPTAPWLPAPRLGSLSIPSSGSAPTHSPVPICSSLPGTCGAGTDRAERGSRRRRRRRQACCAMVPTAAGSVPRVCWAGI